MIKVRAPLGRYAAKQGRFRKRKMEKTSIRHLSQFVSAESSRDILAMSAFALLLLFAFTPTWAYLWSMWEQVQHGDYAHGLLVVVISAWIFYQQRDQRIALHSAPWEIGLATIGLTLASLMWAVSQLMGIRLIENLALYSIVLGSVFALWGWRGLIQSALPLLFLLLALPVWSPVLPLLQSIAAQFSFVILKVFPFEVIKEGAYITVPAGQFLVAEGCSGLRYLLAALCFAGFFVFLEKLDLKRAVLFTALAAGSAVLANTIRIVIVILVGNATAMQHPWVHDHMMMGWGVFAVMLVPVFYLGNRLAIASEKAHLRQESIASSHQQVRSFSSNTSRIFLLSIVIVSGVSAGPIAMRGLQFYEAQYVVSNTDNLQLPIVVGDWRSNQKLRYSTSYQLGTLYQHADKVLTAQYSRNIVDRAQAITWYQAIYLTQSDEKEMVNVENFFFDETRWQAQREETVSLENGATVKEVIVTSQHRHDVMLWAWYTANEQASASGLRTKINELIARLKGKQDSRANVISISLTQDGSGKPLDPDRAREKLNDFLDDVLHQP